MSLVGRCITPGVARVLALGLCLATAGIAQAAKMPGTVEGSINGNAIDIEGTCSVDGEDFEFWSDGSSFAVNRDANGDGMYLNISITKMGEKTYSAMWYGRGGEVVYKGLFSFADRGERSLSVDTDMGRDDMPASFEVRCGG